MTHQEKLDFVCNNMLVQYPPWDGSHFQPYNVSTLSSLLGLLQQKLTTGDGEIATKRLDRLSKYVGLGLKVGISREHLASYTCMPLTEGVEDEDCHPSIIGYICDEDLSDSAFYNLLILSMRIIKTEEEKYSK